MTADTFPAGRLAGVHASPVHLDRERTVDKVAALVAEAARGGARVVAFSEGFLPGFPVWCLVQRPIDQHGQFERLFANSVRVPGPETERLAGVARANDVYLSIGVTERSPVSMGALFNTNLVFHPSGELVAHHRKLVATWAERLVWAHGDGAGLGVVETDLGRLGVLICGENTNPLARYALMAQGEQVHIATWPPVWPFQRGGDGETYRRWIEIRSAAHAFEAKVFSLSVAAHLDESTILACADGDAEVEKVLREAPAAVSLALGPNGNLLGDPIQGEEGILFVDVDVAGSIAPKMAHDVVGGYQRFDVFEVVVNRRRQAPIRIVTDHLDAAGAARTAGDGDETWP